MLDVLILFPASADTASLDDFIGRFLPVIKQAGGLRSVKVSQGDLMSRGGQPPYSRVIELSFESLADWMGWVQRPERNENVADFDSYAPLVVFFEVAQPD